MFWPHTTHTQINASCLCLVLYECREGIGFQETGVKNDHVTPCRYRDLNSILCKSSQCSLSTLSSHHFVFWEMLSNWDLGSPEKLGWSASPRHPSTFLYSEVPGSQSYTTVTSYMRSGESHSDPHASTPNILLLSSFLSPSFSVVCNYYSHFLCEC